MDVNNTPYLLVRTETEFENGSTRLQWRQDHQALMLAQNQSLRLPGTNPPAALDAWAQSTPLALDGFNQIARIHESGAYVEFNSGRGFLPLQDGELRRVEAPSGNLRDLSLGGDGRLAAPWSNGSDQHGLSLFHLAKRWLTETLLPVQPVRAWVDPDNQVWCISGDALMLCAGEPLPLPYTPLATRFEPVTANPHPLRLVWMQSLALPAGGAAMALTGDEESLYILCHDGDGAQQILKRPRSDRAEVEMAVYRFDEDIPFAVDLATAGPGRLAALAPPEEGDTHFVMRDCPVLRLAWNSDTRTGAATLVRERYPMLSLAVPRFVSSMDGQLRYQAEPDPDFPEIDPRPRELHPLPRPEYHLKAKAFLQHALDSGQPDAIWHRVYLEATIPPGCSIHLAARVYNTPDERTEAPMIPQAPPLWTPLTSEIPFAPGLAPSAPGTSGLFEILLQRPTGQVRRLTGRYLQLEVELTGDGRHTPSLFAMRIYCPRFSYQEVYLPELFRQESVYDPDDAEGPANGADTRERFLAALEGMLTPIEARVAASEQLVSPEVTPKAHLPWLAELLGVALPAHWPEHRQRRLVRDNGLVQQWRGTLAGVNLALDIATDGGVQRGEVVVLENFRLRRTMATILGINMDDEDHPLTLGTGMSGNSIVGDSLILSESDAKSFLALFDPDLATEAEAKVVEEFFDQYAHQVSVLLHGNGRTLKSAVAAVLKVEMPAQLQWRIIETEHPFVLGIAPLLAVDTFLETTPDFCRVALNDTRLGKEGVLKNPAAFSPRDINARSGDR